MGNCMCIKDSNSNKGSDVDVYIPHNQDRRINQIDATIRCPSSKQSSSESDIRSISILTPALCPTTILKLAEDTCCGTDGYPPVIGVQPHMLASLALAVSGGIPVAAFWSDDVYEMRLGLCQMTLSTACWLASDLNLHAHGTPSAQKLFQPVVALYFAAGYIRYLSTFDGKARDEEFIVQAYQSGPKTVLLGRGDDMSRCHQHLAVATRSSHTHSSRSACLVTSPQQRVWLSYVKAQRYFSKLGTLNSGAETPFQPMHVVRAGDTVASVAQACGTTGTVIYNLNPDIDVKTLSRGDCIAIPSIPPPSLYTVRPGDTIGSVAAQHELSVSRLCSYNRDVLPLPKKGRRSSSFHAQRLAEGQLLEVPGLSAASVCSSDTSAEEHDGGWGGWSASGNPASLIHCYWSKAPDRGFHGVAPSDGSGTRSSEIRPGSPTHHGVRRMYHHSLTCT